MNWAALETELASKQQARPILAGATQDRRDGPDGGMGREGARNLCRARIAKTRRGLGVNRGLPLFHQLVESGAADANFLGELSGGV